MKYFGENGNQFWWNDDDQDTLQIILSVLFATEGSFF